MSTNSSLISSGITVEELSQKYQKLLQEYNRIRAQHSVLRKAIVNEQSSNVNLSNELKTKENDLRKYSLEIDNLIFHNRGLSKKIEALQEEGSKKKSSSWLPNNQLKKEMQEIKIALDAAVLDLENKIHENESLYLELDEIRSIHQVTTDELKLQNQTLQLKISQILNEYELKIKDFEDGVSALKREKLVVETEMRKVLETMKNLSETPIQLNNSITTSNEAFLSNDMLEFLQNLKDNEKIQSLEGEDYNLLFNFAQKFIKDLASKFNWNEFTSELNLLLKDLRLFLDLQENQLVYINENWKSSNLTQIIVKTKDLQRSFDQSFHKILPSLASIFDQSKPYSWIAHSDEFLMNQSFQIVISQIFPVVSLVSELLNICSNSDKCQEFLPSSLDYENAINQYYETSIKVSELCKQFLNWEDCSMVKLFKDEKLAITKWSRDFKINIILLFNQHAQKLKSQNISIEDHWFIKACNVQMLGILSNLKTSFDRVFNNCIIWLDTFTNVDLDTIESILKITEQKKSKIDSSDHNGVSKSSIESIPSTSFIPYTATLKLLTSNLEFKEEKEQLLQTLQNEIDVNQIQSQTIDDLKKEISTYVNSLEDESNNSLQLKQVIDEISQKLQKKDLELAEALAKNLEDEEKINKLNTLREEEESKLLTNGNHDSNTLNHNNHGDDIDDNQPLSMMSRKINGTKDLNQLNGSSSNFSKSPTISLESKQSNSNSPISNLFSKSYEIQIRSLLEKLEISQAETYRLHQIALGNSQLLKDSELEKQQLRDQISVLTDQLTNQKEVLATVKAQYHNQNSINSEGNTQNSL